MLTSNNRNGLRFLAIGVVVVGMAAQSANASGISSTIHYSTTGTIETTGIGGAPLAGAPGISFEGISGGIASTPANAFHPGTFTSTIPADYASTLPLGEFVLATPTGSEPTTYGALYHINVTIDSIGGKAPDAGPITFRLDGSLGGSTSAHGPSSLEARSLYHSIPETPYSPKFGASSFQAPGYGITVTTPQFRIPLNFDSTSQSSRTPISAVLVSNSYTVPEPGAICPLLLAASGWLIRPRIQGSS